MQPNNQSHTPGIKASTSTSRDLSVLWTQAHPIISAYIRATVRDFHSSEDLLQETAATVAEKFSEYDYSRPFLPWVIGIARNKLLNYLRKNSKDPHVFSAAVIEQISHAFVGKYSELDPVKAALDTCVKQVKGRSKELLKMRYLRDLKPSQIATTTGMTPAAVSAMLYRIRKTLQDCIEKRLAATDQSLDYRTPGKRNA